MLENELNDTKCYFDYIKHLCNCFSELKKYSSSHNFINEQNQKTSIDFFLDNLFLFHKAILDNDNKYHKEVEKFYNTLTGKLYHYTNYPALEKIIQGKSLKLNNLSNMNDSKEGLALSEYLKERYPDNTEQSIWLNKTLEYVHEYNSKIFSFSFSFLKDDAPQWDRYGVIKNNGSKEPCGVCLEIDKQKLEGYLAEQKSCFDMLEIAPVLYVPHNDKSNTFLEMIFVIALASTKKRLTNTKIPNTNDDNVKKILAKYISRFSTDIKHDSFKNEREIRLIASLNSNSQTRQCYTYGSILLSLASGEPDFKLSDIITSITIGPGASAYRTKIETLLKDNNFEVDIKDYIKESNCPLRTN